jgi:DNA polymerase III epsilon subunit-like protein
MRPSVSPRPPARRLRRRRGATLHQALDDAMVTAQLFLILAGRLAGHPEPTVGELLSAAGPALPLEQRFKRAV